MAKVECTVNHPNLHLSVGGKLEKVEKGSVVTVDEKQFERYIENGILVKVTGGKKVKVGEAPKAPKAPKAPAPEPEAPKKNK